MALERRRPLPPGRYWLDVTEKHRTKWETWRNAMASIRSVTIELVEHRDASNIPGIPATQESDFVIFSLTEPNIAYEAVGLPDPTIAGAEIQTSDDTAMMPPPSPTVGEQLEQFAGKVSSGAKVTLGVVVVGGIVAVLLLRK